MVYNYLLEDRSSCNAPQPKKTQDNGLSHTQLDQERHATKGEQSNQKKFTQITKS